MMNFHPCLCLTNHARFYIKSLQKYKNYD